LLALVSPLQVSCISMQCAREGVRMNRLLGSDLCVAGLWTCRKSAAASFIIERSTRIVCFGVECSVGGRVCLGAHIHAK
jgi:hypothetical protein